MKIVATLSLIAGLSVYSQAANAADDFEVLPNVYGACINISKSSDGSARNDCLSSASIYNKSNGSIYFCEAHLVVNVEGLQLETKVAYKKASCKLANQPTQAGGTAYSVGSKDDPKIRRTPPGGAEGTIPARFYWLTKRDKLDAEVCFDFSGYKGFSGCVPAPLHQ